MKADPKKQEIRERMRLSLAAISPSERAQWSARIAAALFATRAWADSRVVMCFLSINGEVETRAIIERAWADSKRLAVPRVDWELGVMAAVQLSGWSDKLVTRRGLTEPAEGQPIEAGLIELMLAPGLAFDSAGNRLGRGGGYFDRFLAQPGFAGVKCGLAFDCQRLGPGESIPHGPTDVAMDLLVSESGVRAFSDRGRIAGGMGP